MAGGGAKKATGGKIMISSFKITTVPGITVLECRYFIRVFVIRDPHPGMDILPLVLAHKVNWIFSFDSPGDPGSSYIPASRFLHYY